MSREIMIHEAEVSRDQRDWYDKMPRVPFPSKWDVRAVPPFGRAMVRYRIQHNGADISVYMDAHDRLGCVGQPYWEIYPGADGDPDRFLLHEVDDMVAAIQLAINRVQS